MKITGISLSDENTASSRIRFFRFLKHLPSGYRYETYRGGVLDCDLLYIQKNSEDNTIRVARQAAALNIPIVYDIDDIFFWSNMDVMMNLATVVTTDTHNRIDFLRQYTTNPIEVVPDALDYVDGNEKIVIEDTLKNIVTFGSTGNLNYTIDFYRNIPGCYDKSHIGPGANEVGGVFIKWALPTFLGNLKRFDTCVLVHASDQAGSMKSNNRLIVCMSIGLPVVTSNTHAYANTLKDVGCEFLVANKPEDVGSILRSIESKDTRQMISDKFNKYAWDNFSPQSSSNLLAKIFENYGNKTR